MQGRTRLTVPLPLPLLLAAAALLALPGPAMAGWDGRQDIGLGDKISAEFGGEDASVHEFRFYAPKGTTVDVKAKADAGLVLAFELWSDKGVEVDLAGATAAGFKKIVIPADGTYLLQVAGSGDAGVYSLTTKGKYPTSVVSEGTADPTFGAVAGSFAQVSVKPAKGSSATAVINAVKYPGGTMTITAGTNVKVADALPVSAVYTVDLAVTGTGNVATTVKLKVPKFKRSWGFGIVEPVVGAPAGVRSKWLTSPHNDYAGEPFRHWDADGSINTGCAKCHSSYGYQDWVGADGSAFEVVDSAAALGSTVDCDACHNSGTADLSTVLFPSGERIDGLGMEARCMQCHQGRESSNDVDTMITLSTLDDDEVATGRVGSGLEGQEDKLSFLNVHYLPAAATLYGRIAKGGYQYAENYYNGRFYHVKDYDTCIECHDAHSTKLKIDECATCHVAADGNPVATYDDLREIRMTRTLFDYDGDGDTDEGTAEELDGMRTKLYAAIQAYALAKGNPIVYDEHTYPYFMKATGGSYDRFTPNLLRACYNLQYATKDPGVYAHNARYVMELCYDSYMSLENSGVYTPIGTTLVRNEAGGHFDATSEAYRHWDEDPDLSASCARCHGPDGFEFYVNYTSTSVQYNPAVGQPYPEGMRCESCHVDNADFAGDPALRTVKAVWWPGATAGVATTAGDPSALCLTCHQGRQSTKTVDDYLAATAQASMSFRNVHYLPAGATLYGTTAKVAYEYSGKTYAGKWGHTGTGTTNQCTYCHMQEGSHSFAPENGSTCQICHGAGTPVANFRLKLGGGNDTTDYDGDGNTTETLASEATTYVTRLLSAIQDYAVANSRVVPVYEGHTNPYWFKDLDGDRICDPEEAISTNSYRGTNTWNNNLMKACYNYQYFQKEEGIWAHNRAYMFQLLYDSIQDVGGSVTGLTRP